MAGGSTVMSCVNGRPPPSAADTVTTVGAATAAVLAVNEAENWPVVS